MTGLTFVPWTRAGASALLNTTSVPGRGQARANLFVGLSVGSSPAQGDTPMAVSTALSMLGPGDVVGIVADEVIRTEPTDGSTGVETEIFPAVEFHDASLPWLFSPAVEDADHRLRPWLCLVVVPAGQGITLNTATGLLSITDPASQLPNLDEAWAWAHVQFAGTVTTPITASALLAELGAVPSGTISRLLCPRQLKPSTSYYACLVPTYLAGVEAGLAAAGAAAPPSGQDPLADAWTFGATAPVVLPVYYSFSFTTGEAGDFLSLAKALAHPPAVTASGASGIGGRRMVLDDPAGTPELPFPGVLLPADAAVASPDPTGTTDPPPAAVSSFLLERLKQPPGQSELLPPLYGAMQAGITRADLSAPAGAGQTPPTWLIELNTDPRLRAFAGHGAQVVQGQQQQLLGAAWDQVEGAAEVNAVLSRAQLARSVSAGHAARHLSGQGDLGLLQVIAPQSPRTPLTTGTSIAATVGQADPALPALLSAPYRRLTRPRGPFGGMVRQTPPAVPVHAADALAALAPGAAVEQRVGREYLSDTARGAAQRADGSTSPARGHKPPGGNAPAQAPDSLRALAVPVTFPAGMVVPLLALAPDAVLAGIDGIPQNTALTLQTNPSVIAAYMVGLNSEVNRELAWHQVPIDRRATPFQYFWDTRGQDGSQPDLDAAIADWPANSTLESHVSGGTAQLVLAVRADLLRRYPHTNVYAVAAVDGPGGTHVLGNEATPGNVIAPTFTALLPPELRLFFFSLAPTEATGDPGWFFVFQEQVTETRFGRQDQATASYWTLSELGLPSTTPHAGDIADGTRLLPVRCAIHAKALLPKQGG